MNIQLIKAKLAEQNIFHAEDKLLEKPSVIGYEKKFRWAWMATQLNTFIVVTDFGDEPITPTIIESHLSQSFQYAKKNYTGWPRGLQSGLGVISVLISSNVTEEAEEYCRRLKSGKKWSAFTIPVTFDTSDKQIAQFEKNPMWGRIYYPHFRQLIEHLK